MKRTIIISLLGLTALAGGCTKWLDVDPSDRILEKKAYSTETGINSILNGFYSALTSSDLYGSNLAGGTVDIMAHYYAYPPESAHGPKYMLSNLWNLAGYNYDEIGEVYFPSIWSGGYNLILGLNVFIENVGQADVLPRSRRDLCLGEALGLRAMLHLDLYRLFGPVETSAAVALPYHRNAKVELVDYLGAADFLDCVLADLDRAEEYLETADPIVVDATVNSSHENEATMSSAEKFATMHRNKRMNYWAVQALKARVHMLRKEYDKVIEITGRLLTDAVDPAFLGDKKARPFGWTVVARNDWRNNSVMVDEVVFGPNKSDQENWWNAHFDLVLKSNEDASAQAWLINGANAVNIFALGSDIKPTDGNQDDRRLLQYKRSEVMPGTMDGMQSEYYVSTKLSDQISPAATVRNMRPLIRISEMAYLRAEAYLMTGRHELAIPEINKVLYHRGFTQSESTYVANAQLPPNTTPEQVREMLDREYYREFVMEGQVFFYLKRNARERIIKGYDTGFDPIEMNDYVPPRPLAEQDFYTK
jgi:hypothetical protein